MTCPWCRAPLEGRARYCDEHCRRAVWRFGASARGSLLRDHLRRQDLPPLELAYADLSNVADLGPVLEALPSCDGWALLVSPKRLPEVLARLWTEALEEGVEIGSWHRRPDLEEPSPRRSWDAVVYRPARPLAEVGELGTGDALDLTNDVKGQVSPAFCAWLFLLLGAAPQDSLRELVDGDRVVERAWDLVTSAPEVSTS